MKKLIANQKEFQEFVKKEKSKKQQVSDAQIKRDIAEADRKSDAQLRTEIRRASEGR